MLYSFSSVRDPVWGDHAQSVVFCWVKFDIAKEEMPFCASPNDIEVRGREIFARIIRGDYGPIAPFDAAKCSMPSAVPKQNVLTPLMDELQRLVDVVNLENKAGSHRGNVLAWGAYIERICESLLIRNQFRSANNFRTDIEQLFSRGLISGEEKDVLHKIRRVRNAFAHNWDISLSNAAFRDCAIPRLKELFELFSGDFHYQEDLGFLVRLGYSSACASMSISVLQRLHLVAEKRT